MTCKITERHEFILTKASAAGFLLLLALLEPSAAEAGPLDCAGMDNPAARLACFDREFPRSMLLPPGVPTGRWKLRSAPSAIPGRTDYTVSLTSQGTIKCRWAEPRPVQLRVRCIANVTSVSLETGCYMASGQDRNDGDVAIESDGGTARVARMRAGADGKSLGLWSGDTAIPFVRELLGKSAIAVRMTPYADDPVSAVFDVRGIDEAIKPARTECGW